MVINFYPTQPFCCFGWRANPKPNVSSAAPEPGWVADNKGARCSGSALLPNDRAGPGASGAAPAARSGQERQENLLLLPGNQGCARRVCGGKGARALRASDRGTQGVPACGGLQGLSGAAFSPAAAPAHGGTERAVRGFGVVRGWSLGKVYRFGTWPRGGGPANTKRRATGDISRLKCPLLLGSAELCYKFSSKMCIMCIIAGPCVAFVRGVGDAARTVGSFPLLNCANGPI